MTERQVRFKYARPVPGEEIRAAGAVLYRDGAGGDGIEVAVIHRPRRSDWTFPKGKLEPGEHVLLAAVREVTEETGIRPVLGPPLATVYYEVEDRPKRVDYWASYVDGPVPPFAPNHEVDRLDWLAPAQARARLSYSHDVRLLDRLMSAGWHRTMPAILLRHASAGRKNTWHGDDLLRPLDGRGLSDAARLADLLACYAPSRVLSSPAQRCMATVRPYAARIGAVVEPEPAFTMPGGEEQAARRRMSELVAQLRAPVTGGMVICGHRENLPWLLAQAREDLGAGSGRDDGWSPPKGGFWVVHAADHKLAALEHHEPSPSGG